MRVSLLVSIIGRMMLLPLIGLTFFDYCFTCVRVTSDSTVVLLLLNLVAAAVSCWSAKVPTTIDLLLLFRVLRT